MPAYNEKASIGQIINGFKASGYVDEVIVVDNNSNDNTKEIALEAGAQVIEEPRQGYGNACKRALLEAKGEFIILTEPDGTFSPKDIVKFLAYTEDFDLIQGTRTTKELIAQNANMHFGLKWGNWVVAKILQLLYNGPSLSDMGCTYRLIKKDALNKITEYLNEERSAFLADMTTAALKKRIKIIEISVNYRERQGYSKITGTFTGTIVTGLSMLKIIFVNLFKKY
jgi:glycosyltransferase involved in cell wall biosynthesis